MPDSQLILATRGSPLALRQAQWVQEELQRATAGTCVEILVIRTTGDRIRDVPLPEIGGKGLFTKEIEDALVEHRAHFAVHSLKDLPTELPEGLLLAAIPRREDARDVLISRDGAQFAELRSHARVGTSSLRRAAQLLHLRPDLEIESLRGNLDTRLRKLREGSLDAIVVAAAGLSRMGLESEITEYFPSQDLCPAAGQGALAIEARADDSGTLRALAALEDPWSRISVTAERALLKALGGGCQVPIGAYAERQGDTITLSAIVIRPDGGERMQARESVTLRSYSGGDASGIESAEVLGRRTAAKLLEQGADRILTSAAKTAASLPNPQAP